MNKIYLGIIIISTMAFIYSFKTINGKETSKKNNSIVDICYWDKPVLTNAKCFHWKDNSFCIFAYCPKCKNQVSPAWVGLIKTVPKKGLIEKQMRKITCDNESCGPVPFTFGFTSTAICVKEE